MNEDYRRWRCGALAAVAEENVAIAPSPHGNPI